VAVPILAALCMLCCDPCMHACMHAPSFRSVNQARLPALRLWCYVWSWWSLNVKRSEVKRVHRIVPTAQTRTAPPPVPRTYLCLTQTPGSKTETKHKQNVKHVCVLLLSKSPSRIPAASQLLFSCAGCAGYGPGDCSLVAPHGVFRCGACSFRATSPPPAVWWACAVSETRRCPPTRRLSTPHCRR